MSRIGRQPVAVPEGLQVDLKGNRITVKGPLGELSRELPALTRLKLEGQMLVAQRLDDTRSARALHGLTRSLVANMVTGVSRGFERRLEINGTGYRATPAGDGISLQVGFSHHVSFPAPTGIRLSVVGNRVLVQGIDKELVGETAARIRRIRPPEPYKGKGIKYEEEVLRKKAGKAGAKKK